MESTSCLRRFVPLLLGLTLVCPVLAGEPEAELEIVVLADRWGDASLRDIQALLDNVRDSFLSGVDSVPAGKIHVKRRDGSPMIAYRDSATGIYPVYLAVEGRLWARFSYQFSHELCHLLMDYEGLAASGEGPHPFGWLHEALCETASLYTMRRMAVTWENAPPYPNWKDYRQHLNSYVQHLLDSAERQLPPGVSLGDWYRANQNLLRAKADLRELNAVAASRLLPLFEAHPEGWSAVARMPAARSADLATYLTAWEDRAVGPGKAFVRRVAECFGVAGSRKAERRTQTAER